MFGRREWRVGRGERRAAIRHWPLAVRRMSIAGLLGTCTLWLSACGFGISLARLINFRENLPGEGIMHGSSAVRLAPLAAD